MTSTLSSESSNPESIFLASLPAIDRAVAFIAHRHALADSDAEEFSAWVRAKLIEDGYRVFREFRGQSSLSTYLASVVAFLFRDYRNSRWGRWRPSAIAKRLGPIGIRFETLVYRDGHSAREAAELLKIAGAAEPEIRLIAKRIPPRTITREVSFDAAAEGTPATGGADDGVTALEAGREAARAAELIRAALGELPPEDQVIVRMRFWDDFSVADIARALGLEQKRLYRRLEAIQASLGAALIARGVTQGRVAELLSRDGTE
ncbi:MAG: sigma-70 family RNA polymerase sigma factor [Gemmatimonadales bacterium]|nr:sigma-70 family RNA polymerase sigma factor [Gemmatimonadales bacterium]